MKIAAESLPNALNEVVRQCKINLLLTSVGNELDGIRGNEVAGDFEVAEVLRRLLDHTGWTFWLRSPDRVEIVRDRPPVPSLSEIPSRRDIASGGSGESLAPVAPPLPPLAQVLVTGTLIRGVDAITAPLITLIPGKMIDSGYAGVQSMVDNTLPITSNNTPRDDYRGVGSNFGFGQGINLRGLGVGATLVLVDGRRQPFAGLAETFVDVSAIPSAAIDHIEVIADGASALYGSDAIAGVVNVMLRHDDIGAETSARYALGAGGGDEALASQVFGSHWEGGHGMLLYQYTDRTSVPIASRSYAANPDRRLQGGNDFRSIDANPGNILDPTTYLPAYAIPPGQDGRGLSITQLLPGQVNLQNQLLGTDLYPQRRTHSFYITAEHEVSSGVRWFFEGRLDQRQQSLEYLAVAETLTVPASNAFFVDPFGHSPYVSVAYSFQNDLGNAYWTAKVVTATVATGLKADLGGDWESEFSLSDGLEDTNANTYNWPNQTLLSNALADSHPATAFNPFAAGSNTPASTLNQIRATQVDRALSRVPGLRAVADGPLFSSSGVSAKLALGLELRQESLKEHQVLPGLFDSYPAFQREIGSAFSEIALSLPGRVEVSLAGRYEHYSDFGSTTNPKVGVRWSPWKSLKLRASWGTSFRAPDLPDLDTFDNAAGLLHLADPKSPTGQSVVLVEQGNSPNLHEEKAATWTVGLDLAPPGISGMQASLTYYSVDYRDRIAQPSPGGISNILNEAVWGEVVQRNPAPPAVMAICNAPHFFGTPSDCQSTSPAAIVDIRLRNLSRTIAKGIDLSLEQGFENRLGVFQWSAQGAYILTFGQAVTDNAPVTGVANTVTNPIKTKARATLSWRERREKLPGGFFALAANFAGAYLDNESVPSRRIASYVMVDAQLGYSTGEGHRWFENVDCVLSATNLFDRNPPFVNTLYGFDQANTPPVARLVTASVRKKW